METCDMCDMCAKDISGATVGIIYGENVTLCSGRCVGRLCQAWAPTKRRVLAYRAMKRAIRHAARSDLALAWASAALIWASAALIWIFA